MLEPAPAPPRAVRLANHSLEIAVFPQIGAKIFDLIHRPSGLNFLWHNPRIAPQPYPIEANFDNYWCGGWDDAFPTCETCTHNGELYPNLGEFRSVSWSVSSFGESAPEPWLQLSAAGPISPVRAEKRLRLAGETLEIDFAIHHEGHAPLDFLWGTHPAFAIEPGCRIHIPARTGLVSLGHPARLGASGQRYSWPFLDTPSGRADMSLVPTPGDHNAGHYVLDLEAGWYALEFPHRNAALLVEFPLDICPHLWLWLAYGGWRGYFLAAIEPWTGVPVTLSDAHAAGTHRTLQPGQTFRSWVKATPCSAAPGAPSALAALLARRGLPPLRTPQ